MKQICLSVLLFVLLSPILMAQDTASVGIFDATADWGWEPEFPPQQGDFKLPGRVNISKSTDVL